MAIYTYKTNFNLTADVTDIMKAQDYLAEDEMVVYLREDDRVTEHARDAALDIRWELTDFDAGEIILETDDELSEEDLESVSKWISGQNSDGIGEGFEQQDFANYEEDTGYDIYDDEEYEMGYENDHWVMASFDWQSNDYALKLMSVED